MLTAPLTISYPAYGAIIDSGSPLVTLEGVLMSAGHPPLYFAWFSSLHIPDQMVIDNPGLDNITRAMLNWNDNQALSFTVRLSVGTHALTFSAKDRPGNTLADLKQVEHAGMADSPAGAGTPYVFHVLLADLAATPARLSRSAEPSRLEAVAPVAWADHAYQQVNRIGYRWRFTPRGDPPGRTIVELAPAANELIFVPAAQGPPTRPPLVRCPGRLPATLASGAYTLTLRVIHSDTGRAHQVEREVVVDT